MIKDIIALVRPQQWVKNLFVVLPLFFSRHLTDVVALKAVLLAVVIYSFIAGSIYCLNDICDREADRLHPTKSRRPIASGAISTGAGYGIALLMLLAGVALSFLYAPEIRTEAWLNIGFYYLLNIAYCYGLKHKALIDVFIVATGFVLRVVLGGIVAGVWVSHWIILMTFLLALFLSFAKRRDDVLIYQETGEKMRRNIVRYNLEFVNMAITLVSVIMVVCYIMYAVSPEVVERMGTPYLYLTTVWVLAGILRYLQLTVVDSKSGSPTKILLRDRFIQLCVLGWILSFAFIIYF